MAANTTAEQRATLLKIIKASRTAFFVTHTPDKGPHGRPMETAEVGEAVDVLYFPTDRGSGKIEELKADDRVFLGYSSGSDWATITGSARIVDDRAKIKSVWTDLWKNWFDGPDDPKLVLIAVTPDTAEYWDAASRAVVLAKMAYTAVTGQKTEVSEHAKIKM